jgi:uncharacterized hydrophobic protein (TIGR00271 family)
VVNVRVVAPPALTDRAREVLCATPSVLNIAVFPGAASRPDGDLILCDVPREDASVVVDALRDLGIADNGAIVVSPIDTTLSHRAEWAERAAAGAPADAVLWEEVEARTSESSSLSFSFVAFMVLATMIAAAGILTDSQVLIIGAMVVGPEFGPLAGFCVGLVQRQPRLAQKSLLALAVGFPIAIAAAYVMTLALHAVDRAPDELTARSHPATLFISHPNTYSVLVALLAGIAGMLSLTTAKSGALMGVLISVATIPAAGNMGVAAAYADWAEFGGAAAQLALNVSMIVVAGIATLAIQRSVYARRRERHAEHVRRRAEPRSGRGA